MLSTAVPPPFKWEPQPTDDYDAEEEKILTEESKFLKRKLKNIKEWLKGGDEKFEFLAFRNIE